MACKSKLVMHRRSFDLDPQTLEDLRVIQLALRCRSGTEAVRESIRRTAVLLQHCQNEREIIALPTNTSIPTGAYLLDYTIPPRKTGGVFKV